MKNKTKNLTKSAMMKNINGLSEGDRAYCGPYGTVTCVKRAAYVVNGGVASCRRNSRKFKVTNSSKIANGGNYTMRSLRKAICA